MLEDQNCINVFYEFVPIAAQMWLQAAPPDILYRVKENLLNLARALSSCHIVGDLNLDNLGLSENYKEKYYFSLDFEINENVSKEHLLAVYHKQIDKMFEHYDVPEDPSVRVKKGKPHKASSSNLDSVFSPQFEPDEGGFMMPMHMKAENSKDHSKRSSEKMESDRALKNAQIHKAKK